MQNETRNHQGWAAVALFSSLLTIAALPAWAANSTDLSTRFTAVSFRNGTTGIYTISLTNNGPAATNDLITISLALPDQFYLVSGGNNGFVCGETDHVVSCVRSVALASGTTTSVQVRVGVCSPFTRVSTTVALAYPGDSNPGNNSYTRVTSVRAGACLPSPTPTRTLTMTRTPTLTPGSPVMTRTFTPTGTAPPTGTPTPTLTPVAAATDLTLQKTSLGAARVGQNYVYTFNVANAGFNATNVPLVISDTLPGGLTYVSASGAGWSCSAAGPTVTCTYLPSLSTASLTSMTMTVSVGSAAFPTVTNTATLIYSGDTDQTNNTSRRPTTVRN